MDAQEILKAKQQYDAKRRLLEAVRYVQLDEFRSVFGGELIAEIGELSLDELMAKLTRIDQAVTAMEKLLDDRDVSESEFRDALGCEREDYERLLRESNPIRKPVPEKLVLMTFDDATIDHYTTVAPILEQYGGKANFFVCEMTERMGGGPGFEDKENFMTWEQIRELADRGHEIVNHSRHHDFDFLARDDAYVDEEIAALDRICQENGIRKPIAFGYPGGRCLDKHEKAIRRQGYHWARGDLRGVSPMREGQSFYDPFLDSPLSMPSFNGAPGFDAARITEVLNWAKDGRVVIFAYHTANGPEFGPLSFEDQVRCIRDLGGRCITFTELEEYIDPERAYAWTHM